MPLEQNEIKVAVEQPESCSRRLSITVPADRIRRTRSSVASQIAGRVRLPGFRAGKVPAGVLEKRFGPSIEQETMDRTIQEAYREALVSENLVPINEGKVENIEYKQGADLRFDVEFEVRPEVQLERLSGFTATRPASEVTEDEVDSVIERLRDDRAEWKPREAGQNPDYGDQVTVEITVLESGGEAEAEPSEPRNYRFVLGEGQAIPMVEESIMTLQVGDEGEFTVRFPEDFPDEARRDQEQRLHIKLVEVQQKELPAADDDLARAVGEFDDMAALRERILTDLRDDSRRRADAELRRQLLNQIIEANPFELPNSLVDRYLDHMTGHSHAEGEGEKHQPTPGEEERISQVRTTLRPEAEWSLKRMMVVERISEQHEIRASQDEIDARVAELAEKHGSTESEIWLQLEKSGQLEALEREMTEDKVFEYLESQNTVL
ncbi:MAG: trigger factor [Gemmatimonadetes bacterium]|jgi:trigger factor|nr:trigger factor [Gemmatimonadota bacterium]